MLAEDHNRLEKIDKLYTLRLDRSISLPIVLYPTSFTYSSDYLTVKIASRSQGLVQ